MVSREEFDHFFDRLGAEGVTSTEVERNMWRVRQDGALDYDLVVTFAPPVVLLRAKVMDRPDDAAADARLARRLLELNASDLLHGAYGFDQGTVVLTDALELAHLDYEEFRTSFESMTLALTGHVRELAACCASDGAAADAVHGLPHAAPTASAEAR
jgi:hypothetical protein